MSRRKGLDIAIVGMACRFPGASDLFAFWENILEGVDATSEIPRDRWDPAVFFDPVSDANDRVPCRRGGYLDSPIPFDPASHGIMPNAVDGGEPEQFLILDTARAALADAGLVGGVPDGHRVEVIIGRGNYFNRGNLTRLQHGRIVAQTLAILESLHPEWTEAERDAVRADLKASLPPFGPATVPGQLTNATAGRVANRLDLSGASYMVDAASASSLVALDLGAKALAGRKADLALVGAVYLEADVDFPLVFRQLGALSRSGVSKPFAKDADGMLSGEGVGVVVLKRLADAERDGDRIYAVLKGVGIASDGRGLSLASPSARGHARAIRRAYRSSGIDPATVALVEGHGLGVPAADRTELRALRAVFPPIPRGRRVLGAVSSMIGHAMPASGIAGLIKTALALHHRVLPPTLNADEPNPLLVRADSPFTLNPKARPWVQGDPNTPRRAGVNAFGFAGINAHAILEEHAASSDADDSPGALLHWDTETILLSSSDRTGLIADVRTLLGWLESEADVALKDLAYTLNTAVAEGSCRLGLVAKSLEDLADRLRSALSKLLQPACRSIRDARGTYFWEHEEGLVPKLAFLFPGEGSQYPGMLADLCPHFPEVRALFDTSDRIARESGATTWPSEHLFSPSTDLDPGLWSAEVAVNVVLSAQWGLYQLLSKLGLRADAVIGHSSGELLALAAAGVLAVDRGFEDKLGELGAIFGRLETSGELPTARLVAVAASREKVEAAIGAEGGVEVAMDNCPHQVVIAGEPGSVEAVVGRLKSSGMVCEDLPFSRAYHTPGFVPAMGPISSFFDSLPMSRPEVALYSCASEARMPDEPEAIRRLAVDQWTRMVGFRRAVEAMHADGVDVFVDVGARGNLAGFVEDSLRGRPAFAVAANLPKRSGTSQLNHLVASLFARGVHLKPGHLYARRRPNRLDLLSAPRKAPNIPTLAVGFPSMSLSEGLIERLRAITPSADSAGSTVESAIADLFDPHTEKWSAMADPTQAKGHHSNGFHLSPPSPANGHATTLTPVLSILEGADQTLLEFQETMAAFLRTQQAVMDAFLTASPVVEDEFAFHLSNGHAAPAVEPVERPWAGVLVSLVEGREAVSMLTLDSEGDPVAEHHTLGGRRVSSLHPEWRGLPVLPFAVMTEMLAEGAARLVPGKRLLRLLDVRAHRWIRYEDEPVALEIRAVIDPEIPDTVRVAIHNRGALRAMKPVEAPVFEGVVAFGDWSLESPIAPHFQLEHADVCRFTPESIYGEQWLFHGPALQAVVGIGPIAMGGIEGTLRVLPFVPLLRDGSDPAGLLTDPIILDNFTHLLGGWGLDRLADNGDVIFPLRMGELAIYGESPSEGTDISCRISIQEIEHHRVLVDADLVRPDGSIWMTIRGWEDWRFHWPGRFRDGFRQPDRTFLGEPLNLPGMNPHRVKAVWLEPPGDMGRPVWRDVLEHVHLGPDERQAYLALPGPDLRRTHRLWGRIAAKEAARRLRLDRGHPHEYPADLIIDHDPLGRPTLRSRFDPDSADLPSISIAHVDGVVVALACDDLSGHPGIDVEPIVERSSTFESTAFLPSERLLLGDRSGDERAEWVARLWCGKEAVAKATRLGFVDGPSGAEVVKASSDGSLGVQLRAGLAKGCPDLAGEVIRVVTTRRGDFVWAWTLGEGMES
jgi:acyl transferase domain-containing protein/phosphopantetheinyl transferase (holo-ACP synthase)